MFLRVVLAAVPLLFHINFRVHSTLPTKVWLGFWLGLCWMWRSYWGKLNLYNVESSNPSKQNSSSFISPLISFISVFQLYACMQILYRFRPKVFYFNAIVVFISNSSCLLLIYRKAIHFHIFLKFIYFYSLTIVCIFSPSLHPTPASPTSLPHLHPPPWFCPCVLYSSSYGPLSPLSPPHSLWLLLDCS